MPEAKMTMNTARISKFVQCSLLMTIFSVTEVEMTAPVGFLNLCMVCASVSCKIDYFHFLSGKQPGNFWGRGGLKWFYISEKVRDACRFHYKQFFLIEIFRTVTNIQAVIT